jgi:hypothetical protein
MIVISDDLVKSLTREVRSAIGIERTPSQVKAWLIENVNVKRLSDSFIRKLLDDRDALLAVANKMRIPYVDNAPPSSEWED